VREPERARPRSLALTVACAFAALAALQTGAFAYAPMVRAVGASAGAPWLPAFVLVTACLALVFLVFLWRLRRWALWGYLAVIAVQTVAWVRVGSWNPVVLLLPALVAGAAAWAWDRLE
jgi:hypothetical protein